MILVLADSGTATGGWIAGNIIMALWLLACVIWLIVLSLYSEWPRGLAGFIIGTLLGIGIYVWASWPFSYDYHHWIPKEGEVAQVSKRLVPNGDSGMQEKVVVRMKGDEGIYGIAETRATLLQKGDFLRIKCKKAYDFGVPRESHGWDCKWVGAKMQRDYGF